MEVVEDSENRITVGGKRKSSNRRSSILKATKSPLKSGPLEDLDPNSLDDKARTESKKARRSSGRRVSFAEKNEIKEFFTEDWQSAWKKEVEKNNLQMLSTPSQGEYRQPAESIKGLETLLKGDIQAEQDQKIHKAELQDMPEVKFRNICGGNEANVMKYERGFYLQSVAQDQIQQTGSVDVTVCHGGIISSTELAPTMPCINAMEQTEEMEYTRCVSSNDFAQNVTRDVESTGDDQTKLFSSGGIEVDETTTQEGIFLNHLSVPSRHPFGDLTSQKVSGNRTVHISTGCDDDLELTTCHSSRDVVDNRMHKRDRRSIYEPADLDVTVCVGSGLGYKTLKHPQEQARLSVRQAEEKNVFDGDGEVELNVTACHGGIINDYYHPEKSEMDSGKQVEDMEHTKCFSTDQFIQNVASKVESGSHEQTKIFSEDEDVDLDLTCQQRDIFVQNYPSEEKRDTTAFLASLKSSFVKSPENVRDTLKTDVRSSPVSREKEAACAQNNQSGSIVRGNIGIKRKPFDEITHDITLQKYGKMQESTYDENIELTACYSYEVQTKTQKSKRRSIYEPADIDVTTCFGPGLINLNPSESTALTGRSAETTKEGSNCFTGLKGSKQSSGQKDETVFKRRALETRTNAAVSIFAPHEWMTQGALKQGDPLDLTNCCGSVTIPNKQSLHVGTGHTSGSTDSLDFTICHGEDAFSRSPRLQTHQNNGDSFKIDSSAFLASLNNSTAAATPDNNDEMDLTATFNVRSGSGSSENMTPGLHGQNVSGHSASVESRSPRLQTLQNNDDSFKIDSSAFLASLNNSIAAADNNDEMEPAAASNVGSSSPGLYGQKVSGHSASVESKPHISEDDNIELTACHSVKVVENNMQIGKRRSIYEPVDIDITSCYDPRLNRSSAAQSSSDAMNTTLKIASMDPYEILTMPSRTGAAAYKRKQKITLDVTQNIHGQELPKPLEESMLELTTCRNCDILDKGDLRSQKVSSQPEETRLELTTCRDYKLLENSERQTTPQYFDKSKVEFTGCGNNELHSSDDEPLSQRMVEKQYLDGSTSEDLNSQTLPQYFEESKLGLTECSHYVRQNNGKEQQSHTMPEQPDLGRNEDLQSSALPQIPEKSKLDVTSSEIIDGTVHLQSKKMPQWLEESTLERNTTCPGQEHIDDEQITSMYDRRKLSIIDETESEVTNKDEQNVTQRSITLKEFLNLTEIVFITEVNTRRSMAVMPPNLKQSDKTQKEKVVSSVVTAPKIVCYEEAIAAVESRITEMKEKVTQQEDDLNAENPAVFMEAQSASKEELMAMRNNARRLRSTCEKKAAREWKEEKNKMNKQILSDLKKNHQSLAADLHIVEESLAMVNDCFNLLNKMDKELDEGMERFQLAISESDKKLQDQANKARELEAKKATLEKCEKEISELENTRDSLQREKQKCDDIINQHKQKVHELEEQIRSRKEQFEISKEETATKSRILQKEYNLLESLQEWELNEWDGEHAKFTFLNETVEMVVFFKPKATGKEGSIPDQEVQSLQLNFADHTNSYHRCVHAAVNQRTNQTKLSQLCATKNSLPEVLYHMSWILHDSKCIGDELFRIGLKHLTTLQGNRFTVLFNSLKARIRFVLHVQLDFESYPDGVDFTVAHQWGDTSQEEIEQTLKTVSSGRWYLRRLVEAGDKIVHQVISSSST